MAETPVASEVSPSPGAISEAPSPSPLSEAAVGDSTGSAVSANTAESISAAIQTASTVEPPAEIDTASLEELLKQANFEDPSAGDGALPGAEGEAFSLPSFQQVIQDAQVSSIDLLRDVELNVKIELGRSRMLVEDVLKLAEGSVVELDKLAGDPVDVFVNDRLVARGEVLVLNDNFCVRINEIVAGAKEEV